jgi:sulfoxide reductase heme-binding subunit YedZ
MTTNPGPHLFWITSRASGTVALVLTSLAVSVGLMMSTRLIRGRGVDLRATHEALSLSALVALAVHAFSLLGDKYLHPTLLDVIVPFVSHYKTVWMSLGIISGWGLVFLGLSYYWRAKIGVARWRKLHRFTALMWLGGLIHTLGMGTDAGQVWFLAMIAIVAVPALVLLASRWIGPPPSSAKPVAQTPA